MADESWVNRMSGAVEKSFFSGGTIVYRDPVRVSLARAFLMAGKFDNKIKCIVSSDSKACVIGTRNRDDSDKIRDAVKKLVAQTIELGR